MEPSGENLTQRMGSAPSCQHACRHVATRVPTHLVDPEHLLGPGVHDDPLPGDGAYHHHLAVAGEGGRLDLDVISTS